MENYISWFPTQNESKKLITYFKRVYHDDKPPNTDLREAERQYTLHFSDEVGTFFLYDEGENFFSCSNKIHSS